MKRVAAVAGMSVLLSVVLLLLALRGCAHSSVLSRARIGSIQYKPIAESSGIVASRKYPGVFWTHNDKGNDSAIYAITREGEFIAEFAVEADNDDWEDIATDDAGHLYIGNIGNNGGKRKVLEVLCVEEPDPHKAGGVLEPLKPSRSWRVAFSEKPFDCESLFVHKGRGYLISKLTQHRPAAIYAFDLESREDPVVLQPIVTLPIHSPVTGADISADGGRLAIVSLGSLDVYEIEGDPGSAGRKLVSRVAFNREHDIEACCFVPGGVLATAETREIYFFPDLPVQSGGARAE